MDEQLKNKLKRLAEGAERGAVRSILKWKYKKEGRNVPSDVRLDQQSREAASLAKKVITKTGKTVWHDLKEVYGERGAGNAGAKRDGRKKEDTGKKGGEA